MIRVLVIASSPIVRAGVEALLREHCRFALLTNPGVKSPTSRVVLAPTFCYLSMHTGETLAKSAAFTGNEALPILLLPDHLGRAELRRALHSGVRAVLPRDATGPEIIAAICSTADLRTHGEVSRQFDPGKARCNQEG